MLGIDAIENQQKGEKREVGRLLKNIIFPGIYREYEDTKDAIKEKKIDTGFTEEEKRFARARAQPTDKGGRLDKAAGSYAFGDSEFEDKMERKTKALKPVRKPDGFVIPGVV